MAGLQAALTVEASTSGKRQLDSNLKLNLQHSRKCRALLRNENTLLANTTIGKRGTGVVVQPGQMLHLADIGTEAGSATKIDTTKSTLKLCSRLLHKSNSLYRRKRDKSEERRARKSEKKRAKEEEELRAVAELSVYSATDNPFHDVNLGQQFRWHKKSEQERKKGMSVAEAQARDTTRRRDAKEELERLNSKRAQREVETRLREEEEMRMQRLTESAEMSAWLEKDGEFQLEQERSRATIRIREKRAKAIDFLALNLKYANPANDADGEGIDDAGLEIDLDEPYNILDVSTVSFLRFQFSFFIYRISLMTR